MNTPVAWVTNGASTGEVADASRPAGRATACVRQERELLRSAKGGDPDARRRLVEGYIPLVRRIAGRYRGLGVPGDDLVQEGAIGLLDAIDRFDAGRSGDFAAFVRWRVRRSILNALTAQSRLVRLPKQVVERRRALAHLHDELAATNGHTPVSGDVAAAAGSSVAAVETALGAASTPVSLDAPVATALTLEAVVNDPAAPDPATEAVLDEQTRLVNEAVGRLPARQRRVIARHFGFSGDAVPIAAIARELHVSPQRARAIERAALYELANDLGPLLGQHARASPPHLDRLPISGPTLTTHQRSHGCPARPAGANVGGRKEETRWPRSAPCS